MSHGFGDRRRNIDDLSSRHEDHDESSPKPIDRGPAMSWTVACFCGTVFETPPARCPTCDSHVPEVHGTGRFGNAAQRPSAALLRDVSAEPTGFGSLERELAELTASALPSDHRR
jgi:hypothetical protein